MHIPPARLVFSDEDRGRILGLIDASLRSGSLTLGDNGEAFEEAFAKLHQVPHAVATSSGTSASRSSSGRSVWAGRRWWSQPTPSSPRLPR
jgi:dTDP-4-amino-4,6-dideoxygalactose transaminase